MTQKGYIKENRELLKECWNDYQRTAHKFKVSGFGILKSKSRTRSKQIKQNFKECFSGQTKESPDQNLARALDRIYQKDMKLKQRVAFIGHINNAIYDNLNQNSFNLFQRLRNILFQQSYQLIIEYCKEVNEQKLEKKFCLKKVSDENMKTNDQVKISIKYGFMRIDFYKCYLIFAQSFMKLKSIVNQRKQKRKQLINIEKITQLNPVQELFSWTCYRLYKQSKQQVSNLWEKADNIYKIYQWFCKEFLGKQISITQTSYAQLHKKLEQYLIKYVAYIQNYWFYQEQQSKYFQLKQHQMNNKKMEDEKNKDQQHGIKQSSYKSRVKQEQNHQQSQSIVKRKSSNGKNNVRQSIDDIQNSEYVRSDFKRNQVKNRRITAYQTSNQQEKKPKKNQIKRKKKSRLQTFLKEDEEIDSGKNYQNQGQKNKLSQTQQIMSQDSQKKRKRKERKQITDLDLGLGLDQYKNLQQSQQSSKFKSNPEVKNLSILLKNQQQALQNLRKEKSKDKQFQTKSGNHSKVKQDYEQKNLELLESCCDIAEPFMYYLQQQSQLIIPSGYDITEPLMDYSQESNQLFSRGFLMQNGQLTNLQNKNSNREYEEILVKTQNFLQNLFGGSDQDIL